MPDTKAMVELEAAFFSMTQVHGQHVHWNLYKVLEKLGITEGRFKISSWLYTGWSRLEAFMRKVHLAGSLQRSSPKTSSGSQSKEADTFLPWPCVNTKGLVFLLCRWAFADNLKHGGLKKPSDSRKSKVLLQALVEASLGEAWQIELLM
eukprot:10615858-Lingulodinium_polyedra.AAC.1